MMKSNEDLVGMTEAFYCDYQMYGLERTQTKNLWNRFSWQKNRNQIHYAASEGKLEVLEKMMSSLNDKILESDITWSLLQNIGLIKSIPRMINPLNKEDWTPLYIACQQGHTAIVELLLKTLIERGAQLKELSPPRYVTPKNQYAIIVDSLSNASIELGVQSQDLKPPSKHRFTFFESFRKKEAQLNREDARPENKQGLFSLGFSHLSHS